MSLTKQIQEILSTLVEEGKMETSDFEFDPSHLLSRITTFRTGGPAPVLFPKKEKVLVSFLPVLKKEGIGYFVLGNGSNVIAPDEGYPGLILCLNQMKDVDFSGESVRASAGVNITSLAAMAQKRGLAGMEFFYGIPGSVGGAVFMNAGAYDGECKDIIESATFLTPEGDVRTYAKEEMDLGYRTSLFSRMDGIILSATFRLKEGDGEKIRAKMEDLMGRRREKQPLEYPSAGSTFKRYPGTFTAKLIDEAGLKGYRVGGAMVSEKHAGFVINYDKASSRDILTLICEIKEKIYEKNGIHIECEVREIK